MKKRVKTVKEYDEICSEKAEGYVFLPEKDMDCLVEYVQTLGKTLKKDEKAGWNKSSIRLFSSIYIPEERTFASFCSRLAMSTGLII